MRNQDRGGQPEAIVMWTDQPPDDEHRTYRPGIHPRCRSGFSPSARTHKRIPCRSPRESPPGERSAPIPKLPAWLPAPAPTPDAPGTRPAVNTTCPTSGRHSNGLARPLPPPHHALKRHVRGLKAQIHPFALAVKPAGRHASAPGAPWIESSPAWRSLPPVPEVRAASPSAFPPDES